MLLVILPYYLRSREELLIQTYLINCEAVVIRRHSISSFEEPAMSLRQTELSVASRGTRSSPDIPGASSSLTLCTAGVFKLLWHFPTERSCMSTLGINQQTERHVCMDKYEHEPKNPTPPPRPPPPPPHQCNFALLTPDIYRFLALFRPSFSLS